MTEEKSVPDASLDELSWTYIVPSIEIVLMIIVSIYLIWGYAD